MLHTIHYTLHTHAHTLMLPCAGISTFEHHPGSRQGPCAAISGKRRFRAHWPECECIIGLVRKAMCLYVSVCVLLLLLLLQMCITAALSREWRCWAHLPGRECVFVRVCVSLCLCKQACSFAAADAVCVFVCACARVCVCVCVIGAYNGDWRCRTHWPGCMCLCACVVAAAWDAAL